MAEEEVKVLGLGRSPYSCRVEIALKLKGVQYEFIEENLSNKSSLLLKYNPVHKKIPVFVHNGNVIAESLVILEYIDETWKGTCILPKDPYERAIARFWSKFLDEKCIPALLKVVKGNGDEKAIDEARELLKILENELKGKKFFGGDNIGLVDIVAVFIGYWLVLVQEVSGLELLTKESLPKLCEWTDEFISCGVVKESLPPSDELRDFLRTRFFPAANASK